MGRFAFSAAKYAALVCCYAQERADSNYNWFIYFLCIYTIDYLGLMQSRAFGKWKHDDLSEVHTRGTSRLGPSSF